MNRLGDFKKKENSLTVFIIRSITVAMLIIGVIALSGCGALTGKARLEKAEWALQGWPISSQDPLDFKITAAFADGKISGRAPVNSYSGTYKAGVGGSFSIGSLTQTEMAGPEPAMRAEEAYFKLLEQVRKYRIDKTRLILYDDNSNELLIFTASR